MGFFKVQGNGRVRKKRESFFLEVYWFCFCLRGKNRVEALIYSCWGR